MTNDSANQGDPTHGSDRPTLTNNDDRLDDWPFVGRYSTFRKRRSTDTDSFRALHINATSLICEAKRDTLLYELTNYDLDCMFITETWWRRNEASSAEIKLRQTGYEVFAAVKEEESRSHSGVAVLLSKEWARHVQQVSVYQDRMVGVRLAFRGRGLLLVCLLYPTDRGNSDRPTARAMEEELGKWIEGAERLGAEVLVAGDFNAVPTPWLDRVGGTSNRAESRMLSTLMGRYQLHDVWREQFRDARQYTNVPRPGNTTGRARLDMFLASGLLAGKTAGTGIGDTADSAVELVDAAVDSSAVERAETAISSTHQFIVVDIAVGQLFPRTPIARQQPQVRTLFGGVEVSSQQWERFTEATREIESTELQRLVREAMEGRSMSHPTQENVASAWMAVQKHLLDCAYQHLPVVKLRNIPPKRPSINILLQAARRVAMLQKRCASDELRAVGLRNMAVRFSRVPELVNEAESCGGSWSRDQARTLRTRLHNLGVRAMKQKREDRIRQKLAAREIRFGTNIREVVDNLLERWRKPAGMDGIMTEPGRLEERGDAVKAIVRDYFKGAMSERRGSDPLTQAQWADYYQPLSHIAPSWFAGLMAPVESAEFVDALNSLPRSKAPGESGITNEMLRHASDEIHSVIRNIFNACIAERKIPEALLRGVLHPIPKVDDWRGDLSQLRPIMLLETPRKLLSMILTRRLQEVIERHDVLRGGNYGFRRGQRATDFPHVLRAVADDAGAHGRGLEVLLLDIRRAYDSVSWISMKASLRRVKVPEEYIELLEFMQQHRQAMVRTKHGNTDWFHPECGLDQGEISSPILWTIFYDTLLCRLKEEEAGYKLARMSTDDEVVEVAYGAFADDLTLVAEDRAGMQRLADVCRAFCDLHDIEIHCGKTVHVVKLPKNVSTVELPLRLADGEQGLVRGCLPEHAPFRLLGVIMSLDGKSSAVTDNIKARISGLCRLLQRKALSATIMQYIINSVIIPAVIHRTATASITDGDCARIERCWLPAVKRKAHLAVSTANSVAHARAGLGVTRLRDAIDAAQITDLTRRLDNAGVLGLAAKSQERIARRQLFCRLSLYEHFVSAPHRQALYSVYMSRRLWERGASVVAAEEEDAAVEDAVAARGWRTAEMVPIELVVTRGTTGIRKSCYQSDVKVVGDVLRVDDGGQVQLRPYDEVVGVRRGRRARFYRYCDERRNEIWQAAVALAEGQRPSGQAMPLTKQRLECAPTDVNGQAQDWSRAGADGQPVTIWTDGSVLNPQADVDRRGGYAAVLVRGRQGLEERIMAAAVLVGRYCGPYCHSDMVEALAIAHALHALPVNHTAHIITDSMVCTYRWKDFVVDAPPWLVSTRRKTATHKVWELIAAKVQERASTGAETTIEWTRGHAGTHGNEVADQLAQGAAESNELTPWTLNTTCAPVTKQNLLLSGVNMLDAPLQVIKQQSRAKYAAAMRARVVEAHPQLEVRLPRLLWSRFVEWQDGEQRRNAFGRISGGDDNGGNGAGRTSSAGDRRTISNGERRTMSDDGNRRSCEGGNGGHWDKKGWRSAFALKLAIGCLPTLDRQHRWHSMAYPSAACPRCQSGATETWSHIIQCGDNPELANDEAKVEVKKAVIEAARTVNDRRQAEIGVEEDRIATEVDGETVAAALVQADTITDVGYLLGYPNSNITDRLKELGLRKKELELVVTEATSAAMRVAHDKIWLPRCDAIKELIGTWKQRLEAIGNIQSPPSGRPRSNQAREPPRVGWLKANSLLFCDILFPLVQSSVGS